MDQGRADARFRFGEEGARRGSWRRQAAPVTIIDEYIASYYNGKWPCWVLGCDAPDHFYARFMAGEMEKKDVFPKRVLDPTMKFVRKRLSTSENEKPEN